jgi:hypothetical protein
VRLCARDSPNQLDARRDIPPLITPADLQRGAFAPVQLQVVVRLKQHVRELGIRDAFLEASLHRLLLHHVVHGEVLADVAHEADRAQREQPLRVVAHAGGGWSSEIEKPLELIVNLSRVRFDHLGGHQLALSTLPARIADHPGARTDKGDGTVAAALQMNEPHHRHEIADVKAWRARIESAVRRNRASREGLLQPFGVLIDQPAPFELIEDRFVT